MVKGLLSCERGWAADPALVPLGSSVLRQLASASGPTVDAVHSVIRSAPTRRRGESRYRHTGGAIADLPLAPRRRDGTRKTGTGEWEDRGIRIWRDEEAARGRPRVAARSEAKGG